MKHPAYIERTYASFNFDVLRTAPCWMTYGERLFLYSFAACNRPSNYLEIGTAKGGSAVLVATALRDAGVRDFRLSLVDTNFQIEAVEERYLGPAARRYQGSSREMIPRALAEAGAPFDLVLIDGDHSYAGAKQDILDTFPAVQPGGYVLLHDAYNLEIAQAIREGIEEAGYVDCGLVCTHGNDMLGREVFAGGPYAGRQLIWGGLYLLRKPAGPLEPTMQPGIVQTRRREVGSSSAAVLADAFKGLRSQFAETARSRPLYIWGASSGGRRVRAHLKRMGCEIDAFIDSDPGKIGTMVDGCAIRSPDELSKGKPFVIIGSMHHAAIGAKLRAHGLQETADFLQIDFSALAVLEQSQQ